MKQFFYILTLLLSNFTFATLSAQTATNLDAGTFSTKLKQLPNAQLVDVRTAGEYSQGHLPQAVNMDIRSTDFQQQVSKLDKNKAVFIYCLSGGRSSSAMNQMKAWGFKELYNLSGGMMGWRASNLPETTASASTAPAKPQMTLTQYQALLNTKQLVLVDFYADWCAPCQKMKPFLAEIANEMKDKVSVVRIDADVNKTLSKAMKVDALPVLILYKNNKIVWTYKKYISKEDLVKVLKRY